MGGAKIGILACPECTAPIRRGTRRCWRCREKEAREKRVTMWDRLEEDRARKRAGGERGREGRRFG